MSLHDPLAYSSKEKNESENVLRRLVTSAARLAVTWLQRKAAPTRADQSKKCRKELQKKLASDVRKRFERASEKASKLSALGAADLLFKGGRQQTMRKIGDKMRLV